MSMLDRKLMRDFARLWAQGLAVALVLASGVATLIIAAGAYRSIEETKNAFYERYRFANVFASVTRAPLELSLAIKQIGGISSADFRIEEPVLLDMEGMVEPATGVAISVPDSGEPLVNRLYIRMGRLPQAGGMDEVAVLEGFANAHGLKPGSHFRAIMNGKLRELTVTGIVLSPEYVYAIRPSDMVPDPSRFGVFYMAHTSLSGIFGMDGAFNSLVVRTMRGANLKQISEAIDDLLKPYGGSGAYDRSRQTSHAYLENELVGLDGMSKIIPPIFLLVASFLVNMILTRLIALEREQIGLLKALGFSNAAIAYHYLKLTVAIAFPGFLIGAAAGNWAGRGLTRLYTEFFSFPFLIFHESASLYAISAGVTIMAAIAGAGRAIWSAVSLPAATAMQPPAPVRYRSLFANARWLTASFSRLTIMAMRQIVRRPLRAAMNALGTSFSVALLITAFFSLDSVNYLMDVLFFQSQRQDAIVAFDHDRGPEAAIAVSRLPGVMRAESFRATPVILRNGYREKHLGIMSSSPDDDLFRILDADGKPVQAPQEGLLVSSHVAKILNLQQGSTVEVELTARNHRRVDVPVTGIFQSYAGLEAYMRNDALDRLIGDGVRISGVRVSVDGTRLDDLYRALKVTPAVASFTQLDAARQSFQNTMNKNMTMTTSVYIALAVIITFGVVYNAARIQLSERARELASLRVFGFTRLEVSRVLLVELGFVTLVAQPLGWILGYLFSVAVVNTMDSDLFRIPLVIERSTFAMASLIALAAATVSALIVRRRIDRLDLVRVLKTRE